MTGKGSNRRGTDKDSLARYAAGWARIFEKPKATQRSTRRVHWVCADCATRAGGKLQGECSTWHFGQCGVCNRGRYVTEPRDYGYPRFDLTLA
jgi:hypothetical protein